MTTRVAAPPARLRRRQVRWVVTLTTLFATIGALYAALRWPGGVPIGSDNDEYRMVGHAIARFEPPIVAGVEGTKYPLGYPSLLAVLEWLGIPPGPGALVCNMVALAAAVAMVAWLAGRGVDGIDGPSPGAALAAGGVVLTSASVWNDVFSVMPELLLVVVVAGLLVIVSATMTARRLVGLTLLAAVAVALKTLAVFVVLGGVGLAWLWSLRASPASASNGAAPGGSGRSRIAGAWGVLLPALAAVAVIVAGMLVMRPYPEHTTGYLATFPLVDPDDASQGRLGLGGLLARTVRDVPATLADIGRAIAFIDTPTWTAVAVALIGLTLGTVAAFRLAPGTLAGPFVAGAAIAYPLGMAAWPYHSSRFGLPMVPIAALGVGWAVRRIAPRRRAAASIGFAVLVMLVATSIFPVAVRGDDATEALEEHRETLAALENWAATSLEEDDVLVSHDYREIARVLERPVQPIAYTEDPDALLAQVQNADLWVRLNLYAKRSAQARTLLREHADRFDPVLSRDGLTVYRIQD